MQIIDFSCVLFMYDMNRTKIFLVFHPTSHGIPPPQNLICKNDIQSCCSTIKKIILIRYSLHRKAGLSRRNSYFSVRSPSRPRTRAVGEGFEPPVPVKVLQFSRLVQSTALPSHRSITGQAGAFNPLRLARLNSFRRGGPRCQPSQKNS